MEVYDYTKTVEIPLRKIKRGLKRGEREAFNDLKRRRITRSRAELKSFVNDYPHIVTGIGAFLGMLGLYAGTRDISAVLAAPFIATVAGTVAKIASEDPIVTTQKRYGRRKK